MTWTWETLNRIRNLIYKASASLSDSDALTGIELFPVWKTETTYEAQQRVRYNGKLYRCEQAHTSQATWTPDATPALWTEVAEPGTIPVWKQPTGAQDAYMMGDKVHFPDENGPVYVCTIDYNIYAPNVAGWELEV